MLGSSNETSMYLSPRLAASRDRYCKHGTIGSDNGEQKLQIVLNLPRSMCYNFEPCGSWVRPLTMTRLNPQPHQKLEYIYLHVASATANTPHTAPTFTVELAICMLCLSDPVPNTPQATHPVGTYLHERFYRYLSYIKVRCAQVGLLIHGSTRVY